LEQAEYIAESYIEGCDLTVGIVGDKAMGVIGVHPQGGLYDYDHKYTTGMSRYEVPADLPKELTSQLRDWSLGIFKACKCRDMARVDFRMGSDNIPVFLEVNTLPGMTATSLLPKSAECFGVSFNELVATLAGFGLQRMKGLN
jgi:D-alanine-D-alanine ligase